MASTLNAVLPVVTLVLGSGLTFLADERRTGKQREYAREDRAGERDLARADRRDAFELEVLRDVYAGLDHLARAVTQFHLMDDQAARDNDVAYGSVAVIGTDEIAEEVRLAHLEVGRLSDLVLDDDLRGRVEVARLRIGQVHDGPVARQVASTRYDAAIALVAMAQTQIASRIRDLYRRTS